MFLHHWTVCGDGPLGDTEVSVAEFRTVEEPAVRRVPSALFPQLPEPAYWDHMVGPAGFTVHGPTH